MIIVMAYTQLGDRSGSRLATASQYWSAIDAKS